MRFATASLAVGEERAREPFEEGINQLSHASLVGDLLVHMRLDDMARESKLVGDIIAGSAHPDYVFGPVGVGKQVLFC